MNRSKDPQNLSDSTQSGFTIIECLLAIIIVSLLMTAIAPVLAISVATRVQARRVELATAAAKAYIDGVRSGEIQPPKTISQKTILTNVPAPKVGTLTCPTNRAYCKPPVELYCINFENQGCSNKSLRAMIIQPFAYTSQSATDPKKGYQLGIRVYRADAFTSGRTLLATDSKNKQKVDRTFTGGTGLRTRQAPLIEMTTEIVNDGKEPTRFADLCKRVYLTKNPGKKDKDAADACS
jgi:prepilin-type N-terminal cleavage/methylation domain-containing protein